MNHDIRTIIDMRGPDEYKKGSGARLLDSVYEHYLAKIPRFSGNFDEAVTLKPMNFTHGNPTSEWIRKFRNYTMPRDQNVNSSPPHPVQLGQVWARDLFSMAQ